MKKRHLIALTAASLLGLGFTTAQAQDDTFKVGLLLPNELDPAPQIKAGVVWVNCFDAGDITTPFGGFKQSGFGRDKSLHAMEKYTDLKLIWLQLD